MVPPARITARASVRMDWNDVEGSRRRYFRAIVSGEDGSLAKKRRPSFEGCVSAERRADTWCNTGPDGSLGGTRRGFEDSAVALAVA